MAQALELSVSKMSAPFLIWNWNDLPDDWKNPFDPVQLRAVAEELGCAPEKIGTRVGLECPDSLLARTYQAHIVAHIEANPDAGALFLVLVNREDFERQYGAGMARRADLELAIQGRPGLRPIRMVGPEPAPVHDETSGVRN